MNLTTLTSYVSALITVAAVAFSFAVVHPRIAATQDAIDAMDAMDAIIAEINEIS